MLPDSALLLLLLICAVCAAGVEPPTNVTVSCRDVNTTVRWDYSKYSKHQTTFNVKVIREGEKVCEVNTTDHELDLRPFVFKSLDIFSSLLYVEVRAVQGGKTADPTESNTFSFNDLKTVHTKCVLDFPPVMVEKDNLGTTVSFRNPVHLHPEPSWAEMLSSKRPFKINFTVHTNKGNTTEGSYDCTSQQICTAVVSLPAGSEECVSLRGFLDVEGKYLVNFRPTDETCAKRPPPVPDGVVLTILLCVVFFVVVLLTVGICKVRAWTMETEPLPDFLIPEKRDGDLFMPSPDEPTLSLMVVDVYSSSSSSCNSWEKSNCTEEEEVEEEEEGEGSSTVDLLHGGANWDGSWFRPSDTRNQDQGPGYSTGALLEEEEEEEEVIDIAEEEREAYLQREQL